MSSLCFTGHREFINSNNLTSLNKLKEYLTAVLFDYVETKNVNIFYAGGACGFDNFASLCVLEVKKIHPEIQLIEVLPFDRNNMAADWPEKDGKLLLTVCNEADKVIEEKGRQKYSGCYRERDQYLVDHADYCMAWYDSKNREKSGTGQTVRMANKKKIPIENLMEEYLKI